MKKIIIICFAIGFTGFGIAIYKIEQLIEADKQAEMERMNARIKELHDSGCSWEEARRIGATEAGFKPVDGQYIRIQK